MRDPYEQAREDMAVAEQYAYEGEPGLEPIVLADECPECGHATTHGEYGCEYERGDAPGDGEHAAMAYPPCGCRHGFSPAAQRNRALEQIRKAARWQGEEYGFIGRELRDRGILP